METIKTEGDNSSKWDILKHDYKEEAERHAKTVSEIQKSFGKRLSNLEENTEKMSEKEFLKWEDEYAEEFGKMLKETERGNMSFDDTAENIKECVAYPGSNKEDVLAQTVEAYSGEYYYDRANELKQAIMDNCDEETAKTKIRLIEDFVSAVYDHIDFKYMDREDVRDYGFERYESDRTFKHNSIIKKLNELNNLAREYQTRPFTARNFWPSDLKEKKGQTPAEALIFRYDRDIVEEYYAHAFPSAVKRAIAKQDFNARYGLY